MLCLLLLALCTFRVQNKTKNLKTKIKFKKMRTKILTQFNNIEQEIDFSKKGLLLISKDGAELIITNGEETTYCFEAFCLTSKLGYTVGKISNSYVKTSFNKLTQPITIILEN